MQRKREADQRVVLDVFAALQPKALTRMELVEIIWSRPYSWRWSRQTADRRTREALAELAMDRNTPVVSHEGKYKIATTPEQRDEAVRQMTRAAVNMLRRARQVNRHVMAGELRQGNLWVELVDLEMER